MDYFESITLELESLKSRVNNFIEGQHHQSDGEWKESVLRAILKRYLPDNIGVGRGFFVSNNEEPKDDDSQYVSSSQIDILIYDASKPVLFQDGDFVIVTPDLVKGIIEVKSTIGTENYQRIIERLEKNSKLHRKVAGRRAFLGLFSYEVGRLPDENYLLQKLQMNSKHFSSIGVNSASIGRDLFIRYWETKPLEPQKPHEKWHLYQLRNKAQAYFIHNVIEFLFPESVLRNNEVWYPKRGKESYKIGEIENINE
ncbi:hypothetical protein LX73_1236 [Fodinibius salinus]|uniref:DUF6602 domain-containing protein n=1 Tax=Fodinibius salinus TaxID=860790 RepID=A0A5D3YJA1_9BACT|nr:DUF6602 domain-containing protein [Fodinibius salinus]TYP93530.1 hypothetical protein LX73_1236 [Fodinibius salinus]